MRNVTSAEPACRRSQQRELLHCREPFCHVGSVGRRQVHAEDRRGPIDEVTNRRLPSSMTYQNGSRAVSTGGSERRRLKLSALGSASPLCSTVRHPSTRKPTCCSGSRRVGLCRMRSTCTGTPDPVARSDAPGSGVTALNCAAGTAGPATAFTRCTTSADDTSRVDGLLRRCAATASGAEMILVPVRDQDRRNVIERRRGRLETPPLLHRRGRIRRNPLANRRVEQEFLSIRFKQDAGIRNIRDRAPLRLVLEFALHCPKRGKEITRSQHPWHLRDHRYAPA